MTTVTVYKDDLRPDLTGTITLTGGPTVTGASVALTMQTADGVTKINAQSCSVNVDEDADTLAWTYTWQSGDTDTIGTYYVYLTITFADGDTQDVALDSDGNPFLVEVKLPYG